MRPPSTWKFRIGLTILVIVGAAALLAPWLPIEAPGVQDLARQHEAPTWRHPFGYGENGIDLASQVIWGARLSLAVGFGSVILSAVVGTMLGAAAGFRRGRFERVLMQVVDGLYAFPGLLLIVALAAVLGPSLRNLVLVLVATAWAGYARLARGLALSFRERDFVQAGRALGLSEARILTRHILPNLVPPLVVQMTFGLGSAILSESSLSFLGLGSPPGTPSWGQLLNEGRDSMTSAAHLVIVPGLALGLTILALNLLGDALRDRWDPKGA